jgi:hypothetical protein
MASKRWQWGWLSAVLLVLAGCLSTHPEPKPPPRADEFFTPPEDDSRFSDPRAAYPPETLNRTDGLPKGSNSPFSNGVKGPGRPGGGFSGPGGPGGGPGGY